jgi:hypothetical protein
MQPAPKGEQTCYYYKHSGYQNSLHSTIVSEE